MEEYLAATEVHETMEQRKFFSLSAITNRIQEILQPHLDKPFRDAFKELDGEPREE